VYNEKTVISFNKTHYYSEVGWFRNESCKSIWV